jgi:chromatin segregation and condensation protein Rec8/ScpA/Scc1 (kleisin family)
MEEVVRSSVNQEQVHDLIFNREIGWQEIIYDLINTEQLDPWDIDIGILSENFLLKIREYEDSVDFFVSSKALLAAALLLRIKSELILSRYMRSIDDILFGREENKQSSSFERIELDEDIPELVPRSPMPRYRKVTLQELIESLNKAINTENRRIKKTLVDKNALREAGISLPNRTYNIKDKLKGIRSKVNAHFEANVSHKRVSYSKIIGENKEERALSFFPVLQLENNGEFWLEQENHFEEIHIWLKHIFLKHNPNPYQDLLDGTWSEEHISLGEIVTSEEWEDPEDEDTKSVEE